jgi:hypothetical protein
VLANIHISDVLAVDLENRDVYGLWDFVAQAFLFLTMFVNVVFETFSSDRSVTLIKRFNVTIWVKLVFALKFAESLYILVEWLN